MSEHHTAKETAVIELAKIAASSEYVELQWDTAPNQQVLRVLVGNKPTYHLSATVERREPGQQGRDDALARTQERILRSMMLSLAKEAYERAAELQEATTGLRRLSPAELGMRAMPSGWAVEFGKRLDAMDRQAVHHRYLVPVTIALTMIALVLATAALVLLRGRS